MTSLSYHDLVSALPDIGHYASRGLIPADKELVEAIAEHARLTAGYHAATNDRDDANTTLRLAPDGGAAISAAISRGDDPAEAADKAAGVRAAAARDVDRATEILGGYRLPITRSAWRVMQLTQAYAPAADQQLQQTLITQGDAVDKARVTLSKAQSALAETLALGAWLTATRAQSGETFPRLDSNVHQFELPDSAA